MIAARVRFAVFATAVIAPSLSAQTLCAPVERRVDAATCVSYHQILDSAKRLKVPLAPLDDKMMQGIAAETDGPAMVASVRKLVDELDRGRKALGASASDKEVVAAARTLDVGVTDADLKMLKSSLPAGRRRSLETPLIVLSDLIAESVNIGVAVADVKYLVVEGASDRDILNVQTKVQAQIEHGADPNIVTNQLARQPLPIRPE